MARMTASVLETEKMVSDAREQVRKAEARLHAAQDQLKAAEAAHRAQIAKSLRCRRPEEKEMAQRIATWWEVPTA